MKPWTGDINNTKNRGIFLRLNSNFLCLVQRQKEKEAGIPFSISPNKQCADEKWEHKQAGEPRMCSPRSENVPLESETIFSERESWLDTKWVSQQHWEQSTDGGGRFSLSVFYHIHFCQQSQTQKIYTQFTVTFEKTEPWMSGIFSWKCLKWMAKELPITFPSIN